MLSELYNKIDLFWAGQLPEAEKKEFLEAYNTDEAFRKEVHFYLNTQKVLKKVADERSQGFENLYQTAKKERKIRRTLSIVAIAALLLCVIGYLFLPFQKTDCKLDLRNEYATTFELNENTMSADKPQQKVELALQQAKEAYQKGNFSLAEQSFKSYYTQYKTDTKALVYIGLTLFQQNKYDEALSYFNQYEATTDTKFSKVKWYKLACFYEKGDKKAARELARNMVAEKNVEAKHAKEVLDCLGE